MKSSSPLKTSEEFLVDILFPKSCIGCGKEDFFVCESCNKLLEYLSFQNCPICEAAMTVSGEKCQNCQRDHEMKIDKMIIAGNYENELLSKIIHFYKYKFVEDLSGDLGAYLTEALRKWLRKTPDLIVPVPLHKKRLRWRGFNQALLLAEHVSKNLLPGVEIPIETDLLKRIRHTPPQMKMKKHSERRKNIQGAFEVTDQARKLNNKNVLLIDDVCTTGATIFECAKEIYKLGPKNITAAVLARQDVGHI